MAGEWAGPRAGGRARVTGPKDLGMNRGREDGDYSASRGIYWAPTEFLAMLGHREGGREVEDKAPSH